MTDPELAPDSAPAAEERARTALEALSQMVDTAEELSRREAAAREATERAARALHDTAGQSLAAASRFVEAARGALAAGDHAAAGRHLDDARACVLDAMTEVRATISMLARPGDAPPTVPDTDGPGR